MEYKWNFSGRYVRTDAERPRWRFTGMYAVTPRLQLGVEFNPTVSEIHPIGNWVILTEGERQPNLSVGVSSDRIFSPEGKRAYYGTVAKSFGPVVAPYIGVSYSEWEERVLVPWGINLKLSDAWSVLGMQDGRNSHLLVTHSMRNVSVSALLVKLRYPGVSLAVGF